MTETIYALASGKGRAGIAVVRLSGDQAGDVVTALSGAEVPEPRKAALRTLSHPQTDEILDRGLVLWFRAPASFTGEDVAELHLHGGPAVVDAVIAALATLPGVRPAEPGEFSRRAFEHGKLDLTQAEGLADLVSAETEAQRKQSLRQMDGALGAVYEGWRADLIRALAYVEAELDFPDEDVPDGLFGHVAPVIARLGDEMQAHLADGRRGEALREGFQVVIIGPPNAGKSSLINALSRRDVAIVSETPGTTRDLIEVRLDLGGYPVTLVDTAGLRDREETADDIEQEGMRRALARSADADLVIEMRDAGEAEATEDAALGSESGFFVVNKIDVHPESVQRWTDAVQNRQKSAQSLQKSAPTRPFFALSVHLGTGMDAILAALEAEVVEKMGLREAPGLTRERHRTALEEASSHLARAGAAAAAASEPELVAEDVRLAARALGRITGRVDVEDILDVVFADFCIGK